MNLKPETEVKIKVF